MGSGSKGKGVPPKTHRASVNLSVSYKAQDVDENIPLVKLLSGLPLSQRVYCLGVVLGMSEQECYNMISGFNDHAFASVLSQQFVDMRAYVGTRKEIYYGEARVMWVESMGILQDAYRMKMAALAVIEVGKKSNRRDDFIIREATKLAVEKGVKPGSRKDKVAEEEEDADDVILRRAENGREADEED